ncbi:S-adenosylmethionine tRNA ribosyltransferase [Mycobacterium scrofulaceum]|uniref:S-adenosylmethionine tRNA ribosyltransferase n=1 Tax=Mycobacterium scrofulaceum TaxID=1783 RepID=A0A1X0KHY7_MYCSC|nr:S-adenosylmethionine tRNA ribosyltransferase [Mycobacterium scrofulaceum]
MRQRLESSIRALTGHRGRRSSICPSDAARAVGGENWRALMADAREVARQLARSGAVQITQRGGVVDPDGEWAGPIRIRATAG